MKNWLDFLQTYDIADNPGDHAYICDLSHIGLISASGEEAESFLQNQFCNDVRLVDDTRSQLNGYCTAKGRLLAFFNLFQHEGKFYLALPIERAAPVLQRLKMFVLMTQVELDDASNELIRFGIGGPGADELLQTIVGTLPEQPHQVTRHEGISVIRVPDKQSRFMIVGSNDQLQPLWQKIAEHATPVTSQVWDHQDIINGIPQIVDATAEDFVPQMLNMQSIAALSFKKGCYPGQEIVARMHYLGKQKRRMYLAHVDADSSIAPGTSIFSKGSDSAQSVGTIVSCASCPDGGQDLLVVLQIASAENAELHPENQQNVPLKLKDLPYTVEVEGDDK